MFFHCQRRLSRREKAQRSTCCIAIFGPHVKHAIGRPRTLSVARLGHFINCSLSEFHCDSLKEKPKTSNNLLPCALQVWWLRCRRAGTASSWTCRTASTRSSRAWARSSTAYILCCTRPSQEWTIISFFHSVFLFLNGVEPDFEVDWMEKHQRQRSSLVK